jgi:hypothetical protein
MWIRIRLYNLVRIRILLLIKVMRLANTGLQTLQGFILSLQAFIVSVHGSILILSSSWIFIIANPDSDSAFHSYADPDPTPKHNVDPIRIRDIAKVPTPLPSPPLRSLRMQKASCPPKNKISVYESVFALAEGAGGLGDVALNMECNWVCVRLYTVQIIENLHKSATL